MDAERYSINLIIPVGILFALIQAVGQHAVNLADSIYAPYPSEIVFWFNFFISTILGVGTLCYLNSAQSRNWFSLPKERKNRSDYPWWILVLLIVTLCPVILFKSFYLPNVETETRHTTYGTDATRQMTEQSQTASSVNASSKQTATTAANVTRTESSQASNETKPPSPGDRVVLTVRGVEVAFRYCPPTSSEAWKKYSGNNSDRVYLGSPESESGRFSDESGTFCLLSGFWIMETEVTQGLWKSVMGYNPSELKSGDQYPVENVSWNDCQDFLRELNENASIKGFVWRLPTEAQWEYACRAGTETALPNGKEITIIDENNAPALDDIAWYAGNSRVNYHGQNKYNLSELPGKQYSGGPAGTHPVGSKRPNRWGLFDMIGNVNEWCSDRYAEKRQFHPSPNPTGPLSGEKRVFRGGGWSSKARYCRSAWRGDGKPDMKNSGLGLRVVLVSVQ